jgi:hypothetical protein
MCRLTGQPSFKPRKAVAYKTWAKHSANKPSVDAAYAQASKATKGGRIDINAWAETARAMFDTMPVADQKYWERQTKKEHAILIKEWEEATNRPASSDPEARQR